MSVLIFKDFTDGSVKFIHRNGLVMCKILHLDFSKSTKFYHLENLYKLYSISRS